VKNNLEEKKKYILKHIHKVPKSIIKEEIKKWVSEKRDKFVFDLKEIIKQLRAHNKLPAN